jgi:predicted GIY-YIG superfamily endonuclease
MPQPHRWISTQGVYLLHFSAPYRHARHYLGFSRKVASRVECHQKGHGVPLTRAARKAGITFELARVWPKRDWRYERHLRRRKNNRHLCPICNPSAYHYPVLRPPKRDTNCPF